ncbi:LysR family transcriptional regulator [Paraburkholderia humisilvae]|uniref:HTH-type transcriptional regulator YhaJ n=1 Tax=Paraburkholderia humisilvae TaxID=627669 RepID=A0A6J5DHF8_9BURK|nr:LysR family transcriptional regulator [Paraburkholderia humisilvae]CAB3753568.1 HTH-type transcriptional regulator YhaJ [Paraburkholderia humisilvae]
MIDPLNLDHLRVFVAIADQGSFSAAARHLHRAQSAVSNAIASLESTLGVALFDRGSWKPRMTTHGQALLIDARAVIARADQFKARALGLTQGLEAELSIVLDVMFPMSKLVELVTNFQQAFPGVVLRVCIDALGGVPERVLNGGYDLGVQGSLPDIAPELASHAMREIAVVPAIAPGHPLARQREISNGELREHAQIVLTDHSSRTEGRTFSVYSDRRILTADLGSKRAMLLAGLGWGFMPRSFVEDDLSTRRLIELDLKERPPRTRSLPLFAVYRYSTPLGPAGRWVLDTLLSDAWQAVEV